MALTLISTLVYFAAFEKGVKQYSNRPWFRLDESFGFFVPSLVKMLPLPPLTCYSRPSLVKMLPHSDLLTPTPG